MKDPKMLTGGMILLALWCSLGCASENRDWLAARQSDEIEAYQHFIGRHPNSEHAPEARQRLVLLRRDLPAWERATSAGTLEAYERFILEHSDSPYAQRARDIVVEWRQDVAGRDIVDALALGRVHVRAVGSGIGSVALHVRRAVGWPVRVTVPVGTYFECRGPAQNMIAIAPSTLELDDDAWHTLTVDAACVDRLRSVPESGDAFNIRASCPQPDLSSVVEVLRDMQAGFEVQQAAIWIVIDNATYADLGILTRSPWDNSRLIDESSAARALYVLDRAGIDITRKAIWRDRQTIAAGLENPLLADWLERKAQAERP
jgi:hypothetical protein